MVFFFFVYNFLVWWNFIMFILVNWGLIRIFGGLFVSLEWVILVWRIFNELFMMFIISGGLCLLIFIGIFVSFFLIFLIIFVVSELLVCVFVFLLFCLLFGENYCFKIFWFLVKKFLVLCWFFLWFWCSFFSLSGLKLVFKLIVMIKLVFNWW